MQQQPLLRRGSRAAHRLGVGFHANRERAQLGVGPAGRNRIDQLALQNGRVLRALDVDNGRVAADRDRLFERSKVQFHVDRRGEVGRQIDAVAHQRGEAGERERHFVEAGPQIDNRVSALLVGDRVADPLDQRGARGLDGHAGQNAAARILDDARDGALCRDCGGDRRKPDRCGDDDRPECPSTHGCLLRRSKTTDPPSEPEFPFWPPRHGSMLHPVRGCPSPKCDRGNFLGLLGVHGVAGAPNPGPL